MFRRKKSKMGKKSSCCFSKTISRRRSRNTARVGPPQSPQSIALSSATQLADASSNSNHPSSLTGTSGKGKKKPGGTRLWMRIDKFGNSEVLEFQKNDIIKCAGIPARDLRILGSAFSLSSNILAREKAMVLNLEFVRAIVTAEEVLILDPLHQEVIPFVDQLTQQLPHQNPAKLRGGRSPSDSRNNEIRSSSSSRRRLSVPDAIDGFQSELPFEFQILEIALEVVCTYLDATTADLERDAYPVLDDLARNVNTNNLEQVRALKSNLTRLLARVQRVKDEIEHLLDNNEDMMNLYLTRKQMKDHLQSEALILEATVPESAVVAPATHHLPPRKSNRSSSLVSANKLDANDVEELEMLLEAYFAQLTGTSNKILSVREYINDTEDYVNIQLDNQRNELIQIQLILSSASVVVAAETAVVGQMSINIPCIWYNVNGIFGYFVAGLTTAGFLFFLFIIGYAKWKKLLGS